MKSQYSATLMTSEVRSKVCGLIKTRLNPWPFPLPALSNAGQGSVHTGEEEQRLEHQHHRGDNQTEHVAWRSVPSVDSGSKEFVPSVNVTVCRAYEQSQVAQLRLRGKKSHETKMLKEWSDIL